MSVIAQRFLVTNCLLVLTLLMSCNRSTTKEDLKTEMQSVSSWSATAQMIGSAWLNGNLPNKYAQKTLKKTQTELLKTRNNIANIKISNKDIKNYKMLLLAEVLQLANHSGKMSETIAKNNHFATQRELQQLRVEIQNLNQLKTIPEASYEKNF